MQKAAVDANGIVTSYARIDPIGGKDYLFINPYTLDPNNNNIMYLAGGKYLWRNSDLSAIPMNNTWDSISTNWTQWPDSVPVAGAKVTAVAVAKSPANRVYYGTSNKKVYRVDNANTGTPTPVDITSTVSASAFPNGGYVNNIAVDPTNGDNVIVLFSNYNVFSAFYSTNAGATWTKIGGNLEPSASVGPSFRWASILPVGGRKAYFVATSTGMYATDTLMGTNTVWVQQGTNQIGNMVCDMIDTRAADGTVLVATHGHGIYSTKITSISDLGTTTTVKELVKETNFTLYPNPASGKTTIKVNLFKEDELTITITDLYGRLVKTVKTGANSAGANSFDFDVADLKAGNYYCTVEGRSTLRITKPIVVVH
jgi:hypothetical protein